MKIRTTKFIIKQGFINTYRNKLMSLASLGIVAASLVIFGIFWLVTVNLNYNMKGLTELPEMQVYCYVELDDAQVMQVENAIKSNEHVQQYTVVTRAEAFEKVKNEMLSGKEELLEGWDESIMPVSFIVKLKDSGTSREVAQQFRSIEGVEAVECPQETIEIISGVARWIRLISIIILIVLLLVSMFIIANTIKITVYARQKEISIMKYIGATDWFIRLPFVIEGIIIGAVGALLAFILVGISYNTIEGKVNQDLLTIIKFVKLNDVQMQLALLYSMIGITVGMLGSAFSIRKYLQV